MKNYGPDSKQSWLVVVAVGVMKFMLFGPLEVAGMLMVYTVHRYGTTREAASLPYALVYTIRNGSGPIIAYIGNIIGLRTTTLIGTILSSIAIGACFLAESVTTVTILWGVLFGFGFAFEGLFLNFILMEHFRIDLSKALGITNSLAVLGVCCFAPYLDVLENTFGLSGAFLLFGGATLHSIPAAYFLLLNKPFTPTKLPVSRTPNASEVDGKASGRISTSDCNDFNSKRNDFTNQQGHECDRINSTGVIHSRTPNTAKQQIKTISYRVHCTEAFEAVNRPKTDEINDVPVISNKQKCISSHAYSDFGETATIYDKDNSMVPHLRNSTEIVNGPEKHQSQKLMKTLFAHPVFWFILICNGMHYFTLPAFLTLLVDYAIDIGIDPVHSKYIVIYSTCAEIIGCLVLGWLADLKLVSSNVFAITLFFSECVALVCLSCAQNIIFMAVLVLVFQWAQTGITLIYPSVVFDSLEKEIQSSAMASMFILAAPLDLAISPLIGYFRDNRGSYTGVYLTLALAAFIGTLSQMCVLKCVNRRKQSKPDKKEKPVKT